MQKFKLPEIIISVFFIEAYSKPVFHYSISSYAMTENIKFIIIFNSISDYSYKGILILP